MNHNRAVDLDDLLEDIHKVANLAPEQATSMPPGAFTSPDLLALERERIFSKEWICVGRTDELLSPGEYFTTEVNKVPIIIVRNDDNELQAMVNVCRHRMAILIEGRGKTRLFVCPYHAWSYDCNGKLALAPGMESKQFESSKCQLTKLGVETCLGFIYVNLDPDAASLSPRLQALQDLARNFHVDEMNSVWKKTVYWKTNWKVLIENFLETYHITTVHKETLEPYGSPDLVQFMEPSYDYSFYIQGQEKNEGLYVDVISPEVLIENPDLGNFELFNTLVGCIFPSHLMSITWFGVLWLSLQPVNAGEIRVDWGVLGPVKNLPVNADSYSEYSFPEWINQVNNEDKPRVEAVQRGAESGFAEHGPLHPTHEQTLLHFIRYLSGKLTSGEND